MNKDHKPHRSSKDLSHQSPPLTGALSAAAHPHLAPHTARLEGSGHGVSPAPSHHSPCLCAL